MEAVEKKTAPVSALEERICLDSKNKISFWDQTNFSLEFGQDYLAWSLYRGIFSPSNLTDCGILNCKDPIDSSDLTAYLDKIIAEKELKNAHVNIFLSLPDGLLRCFYVPFVPKNELEKVVQWEASKVFPFSLENAIFDWKIIDTIVWGGAKKYEIQAAAISRKKLMPVFKYFSEKKFNIDWITFTSLAWEKLFQNPAKNGEANIEGNHALVRLAGNGLTILFFQKNNLEFLRESGLEAGSLGGGFEETLRYLEGSDGPGTETSIINEELDYKIVAQNISDSLDYYHGQFSQRAVEKIYLSFPRKIQDRAIENIGSLIEIETLPALSKENTRQAPANLPSNMFAPSGLKLKKNRSDLNLIPHEYMEGIKEKAIFRTVSWIAVIFLLILGGISFYHVYDSGIARKSVVSLEDNLDAITKSSAYTQVISLTEQERGLRSQLITFRGGSYKTAAILRALSNLTPEDIRLINLNIYAENEDGLQNKNTISLSGFTLPGLEYPEVVLADYINNLKKLQFFENVELKNQEIRLHTGGKRLDFTLEVGMK